MDLSIYNEMTTDKDAENTLFEIVFLICDDGKIEYPHTENWSLPAKPETVKLLDENRTSSSGHRCLQHFFA